MVWSYVDNNGVPALMKDVVLSTRNGHLESFLDNSQLYTINGTPKLTEKDAIELAMQAVENFSRQTKDDDVSVSGFKVAQILNASLSYVNYFENNAYHSVRSGNSYLLYPSWYIRVGFDKVYPGNLTGLNIRIWADTGNISSITPMIFTSTPSKPEATSLSTVTAIQSETTSSSNIISVLPVAAIAPGLLATLYILGHNKKAVKYKRFSNVKRKIITLIMIALPLTLIAVSPIVQATDYKAEVCIAKAAYPTSNPTSFIQDEIDMSYEVGGKIQNYFDNAGGFDTSYTQISNSSGEYGITTILNDIAYDETNYAHASAFAFGNGGLISSSEYGYSTSDSPVRSLNSTFIDASADNYQTFSFVWAWSCMGAGFEIPDPYYNFVFANAWTQRDLSTGPDGYNLPDHNLDAAFIGFKGFAPFLISESFDGYTQLAYPFPEYFYQFAVSGYTVHNALNMASEMVYATPYDLSPFAQGYSQWWPGGMVQGYNTQPGTHYGAMEVFGNADITISPGTSETVSEPSISGPTSGTINTSYDFDVSSTTSDSADVRYWVFWGDGSRTLTYNYSSGYTATVSHSYGVPRDYTITVFAESTLGVWSNAGYHIIYFTDPNAQHTLYVQATDVYNTLYPEVYLDGEPIGTAPLSISVSEGWHYIDMDSQAYDPYFNWYVNLQFIGSDDGHSSYSGNWIPIYYDMYSTGTYW